MTEETKKIIIEQTLAGLTDEQIAEMIGYSAKAVKYQRTKAGIIKGAHGHVKRHNSQFLPRMDKYPC